jgi:DNA-binding transcriptional regulator/RsmH inhibitor MraZ
MYAVEFEVDAKGRIIEIPPEFEALASKHLKVMILVDEHTDNSLTKPIQRLSVLSIDTRNFKFDREEANAR